jgi:hypothetical protein
MRHQNATTVINEARYIIREWLEVGFSVERNWKKNMPEKPRNKLQTLALV